ncbi:MAG: PEGA domain-containing protein [Chlamydiales bacterium]|nr:PEGA domain-containing protein [Chlamydiales bacterium]
MKRLCNILIVTAMGLLATGCATIAGDNTRDVRVETRPAGATIYVDNQRYGVTPAVVTLPSYIYGGKLITVKKDGYQEQSMMVNSQFQPVALLDIFFWPTFIIDGVTGNIVKMNTANRSFITDLVPQDPIK